MWKIKGPTLKEKIMQLLSDESIAKRCQDQMTNGSNYILASDDDKKFSISIVKDLFENVPEYNSEGWNPYPTVTPPVDGKKWLTQDEDGNLAIRSFTRTFEEGIDYSWEDHDDRLIVAFRSLPAPYQPESNK